MHLPFRMGADCQQLQPLSWTHNDSQQMYLSKEPNLLPQRDVDSHAGSFFGSYSGYFGTGRKSEIDISGQESGILNELSRNASMSLQLGGQYPYPPYDLNFLSEMKFQPAEQMDQQENHVDYHTGGSCEATQPAYDTTQCSWASTSSPCSVAIFGWHLCPRVRLLLMHSVSLKRCLLIILITPMN